jgi:dihydrofolate reductase
MIGALLIEPLERELRLTARVVLAADNIEVRESIQAEDAHLAGEVCLRHAVIGGGLYLSGSTIANPGGKALRGPRLEAAKGVLGSGKRLFRDGGEKMPLKLTGSATFETGVVHPTPRT